MDRRNAPTPDHRDPTATRTAPTSGPTRARRGPRRALLLVAVLLSAALGGCRLAEPPPSNLPPTARIAVSPASGSATAPIDVTFDAGASSDPDGAITTVTWTVDGRTYRGTSITVTFTASGDHAVVLRVVDAGGASDSARLSYAVLGAPPPPSGADLSLSPDPMDGVTSGTATVTSSGAWTLSTSDPSVLHFQPTQGSGDASVAVTVDPTSLAPGSYTFGVALTAGTDVVRRELAFSFPDVTGAIVVGNAAALEPAARTGPSRRATASPPTGPGRLLVGVTRSGGDATPSLSTEAVAALSAIAGVRIERRFDAAGVVAVRAADARAAAAALRRDPGVRYVEPVRAVTPFAGDPYRSSQWNLDVARPGTAWATSRGAGVTVAVLDDGFVPSHEDLAANVAGAYDAVTGTSGVAYDPSCDAHGTHVAGIVAAVTDNGIGVAGTAPDARLLLVRLGDHAGACAMDTAALVAGLDYVTNGGSPRARVVNLSLGFSGYSPAVDDAVRAAHAAGVTVVAATGNDGAAVAYPAALAEVIAVGATGFAADASGSSVAAYSSRGPETWVVAPGGSNDGVPEHGVLSTVVDPTTGLDAYGWMVGTSMAAPLVSGIAALVLSAHPGASPAQVAQALADGATDLGPAGRDDASGYGLVDAPSTLQALAPTPTAWILRVSDGRTLTVGADRAFTVPDLAPGTVTLTAGTDDNGNGVLGDPGEYLGQATVDVRFDAPDPSVTIPVSRQ